MIPGVKSKDSIRIINKLPCESFQDLIQPHIRNSKMNFIRNYFKTEASKQLNGPNLYKNNIQERMALILLNECQKFTMISGVGKATEKRILNAIPC